tara:strand:+ start:628 stop:849 length:222 start_codon:yes stop_codon:yes gene_type:complete
MIIKLKDKNYLRNKIEETYNEADMIAELICEGGAEGAYTPEELSKMQYKVDSLQTLGSALEIRLSDLSELQLN